MRGCLSLPFRLAAVALMALGAWVAWENRVVIRRWVHRATAEAPAPAAAGSPEELGRLARARLDSLERLAVDSVLLSSGEVEALVRAELPRRAGGALDSLRLALGDGEVTLSARVDGARLPPGALGDLADLLAGSGPVEASGPVGMRRLGVGEWRLASLRVRGVPLPRALWSRLVQQVAPGEDGSVTFELPGWVTGLRLSRGGAVLYGRRAER